MPPGTKVHSKAAPARWLRALAPLAAAFALLAVAGPARAERLNGEQIRELFTDNTVAGTYVGGGYFSEYHAPDGRALGDNGFNLNVDACWNVDADRVCYHYGPMKERRTYCFRVELLADRIYLIVSDTGRLNAIAKAEKGNPKEHGDGGRRWSCDDLLSGSFRRFARRTAR